MALNYKSFLEVLEDSYTAYYNIIKEDLPKDLPLLFKADYFKRAEKYWLSKNIPIWGNETNEFAYIFAAKSLDLSTVEKCVKYSLDDGLPRVKPHKEHQYTNIKTLFVAESFGPGVDAFIKKQNFSTSYNHGLFGFTNLITCSVDVDDEKVITNRVGHDMKKYFKKLFAAQHKD